MCMSMSPHQNAEQNYNVMTANKYFENLETTVTNQNYIHEDI